MVCAGLRAPRRSPGPLYMPRSVSLVGLAQRGVIPQNNSTLKCSFCDPVVLGIQLCRARQAGYDAIRVGPDGDVRLSIKSACFPASLEAKWRIGTISLEKEWDATLMVLLTPDFEPREIWEADREAVMKLFENAGRTDPGVKKFKSVATMVWPRNIT